MLHEALDGQLDALKSRWRERGNIRIEPFLKEEVARGLLAEFRLQPFSFKAVPFTPVDLNYQFWQLGFTPDPDCAHVLCAFGRWLREAGADWLSRLTGLELITPPDQQLFASLYSRGCYLDAHNDNDGARAVAYVLGLTPETWPEDEGGHLEFVQADGDALKVTERRAPGWNTLDLFDVRPSAEFVHRIPLLRGDHERRTVTGWLYPPSP